ncbi:peptidase, M23 family [Bifidobacterium samirii]|uniref:Peptidase, M23 family n=1 Tax=Bifidobacterium samirii TaxID=2306974 RepID=A0A430FH09_9BIFI|nr:peptidase, M23 family [Bifidobacterium samirii]
MTASLCATGALACTLTGGMTGMPVRADDAVPETGCTTVMTWPVERPKVTSPFDEPEQRWLAGHRGVDLEAEAGTELTAPADGTVSFAGKVGGKSVVSLNHGNGMTSSFEPAATDLDVGASVLRGEPFARSDGKSDHCDDACVHWGVRRSKDDYLDPQRLVSKRRIALKPVE